MKVFDQAATEIFRDTWSRYDPFATGFIRVEDFKRFMFRLGESCPQIGWTENLKSNEVF